MNTNQAKYKTLRDFYNSSDFEINKEFTLLVKAENEIDVDWPLYFKKYTLPKSDKTFISALGEIEYVVEKVIHDYAVNTDEEESGVFEKIEVTLLSKNSDGINEELVNFLCEGNFSLSDLLAEDPTENEYDSLATIISSIE